MSGNCHQLASETALKSCCCAVIALHWASGMHDTYEARCPTNSGKRVTHLGRCGSQKSGGGLCGIRGW